MPRINTKLKKRPGLTIAQEKKIRKDLSKFFGSPRFFSKIRNENNSYLIFESTGTKAAYDLCRKELTSLLER